MRNQFTIFLPMYSLLTANSAHTSERINENGMEMCTKDSKYVYLSHLSLKSNTEVTSSSRADFKQNFNHNRCFIVTFALLKKYFRHNFIAAILGISSSLLSLHYETVLEIFESRSITFLFGLSQTGKIKFPYPFLEYKLKDFIRGLSPSSGFWIDAQCHQCHLSLMTHVTSRIEKESQSK